MKYISSMISGSMLRESKNIFVQKSQSKSAAFFNLFENNKIFGLLFS